MTSSPIDVVVLTLNSEPTLRRCLESVKQVTPESRIIVVDGGSNDKSISIAEEFGCEIHVKPNLNMGEARLFGFRQATSDWFINVDSDVVLHKEWLTEVSRYCKPKVGVVETGRDCYYKIPHLPISKRGYFGQNLINREVVKTIRHLSIRTDDDEFFRRTTQANGWQWLQINQILADHYGPCYSHAPRYPNMKLQILADTPDWMLVEIGQMDKETQRTLVLKRFLYCFLKSWRMLLSDLRKWVFYCKGVYGGALKRRERMK